MYGLPQAGILANKLLRERLARHGYFEQLQTPGLWKHTSCPIWFNLCVDDFGVKYIGDDNLKHLFAALPKETYDIVEDWSGNLYCGILLDWNYDKRYVDISMSTYVGKQLLRYEHPLLRSPNIAHTARILSSTAKTIKKQCPATPVPNLMKKARSASNKL